MKNKFKELVLPVGAVALAALPFVNVVSCSNNNQKNEIEPGSDKMQGISNSAIKEFESNLVDYLLEDQADTYNFSISMQMSKKFDEFFKKIENPTNLESKSIEEVQQLSNDIFNKLEEKDLEKIIKNILVFGNMKSKINSKELDLYREWLEFERSNMVVQEIENFSFDKNNKAISFTLKVAEKYEEKLAKYNNSYNFSRVLTFNFENIKIEPSYYEMDNNAIVPIIKFSDIQDKNPSVTFLKDESRGIYDTKNFKKLIETRYDLIDSIKYEEIAQEKLPSKDEFVYDWLHGEISEFGYLTEMWSIEYLEKNGEKLGFVNDKFKTVNYSLDLEDFVYYTKNNCWIEIPGFLSSNKFNDSGEFVGDESNEYQTPRTTYVKYLPIFMSNPNSIDDIWYVFQKNN